MLSSVFAGWLKRKVTTALATKGQPIASRTFSPGTSKFCCAVEIFRSSRPQQVMKWQPGSFTTPLNFPKWMLTSSSFGFTNTHDPKQVSGRQHTPMARDRKGVPPGTRSLS